MQMEIVHAKPGSCCVKSHGSLSNRIITAYLGRISSSIHAYHDDGRLMDVLTSSFANQVAASQTEVEIF